MKKIRRYAVMAGVGAPAAPLAVAGCMFSAPPYKGPKSKHFDGERFHNLVPKDAGRARSFLQWIFTRTPGHWDDWVEAEPGPRPPERVDRGRLRVTFVNHATVLVQMDGLNILTDPIWSRRASPVSFAGPERVRPAGIRFEDLPPIDLVLVSHNHYDHLDVETLRRLSGEHRPRILTGLGNSQYLDGQEVARGEDMDWWTRVRVSDEVQVTYVPAQHFSSRGLMDRNKTLWGGFVIEGPAGAVYFAGDTGWGPHFKMIAERFPRLDLAILPIGAYQPRWFMGPVHISPAEAVDAHRLLGARYSLGMHFGTFRLADDAQWEAVEDLNKALAEKGVPAEEFWVLGFGEGRDVSPTNSL